jgi:NAD(P)-dependent dehydrogenase (short-subunit alcohol dehydrogenase family)
MTDSNPVAVVAGVGPGLGASLCRTLAGAGYRVAALARTERFAPGLAAEVHRPVGEMRFYACDLTQGEAVEQAFRAIRSELGSPAVLVYNAGAFLMQPTAQTTPEAFQDLWALNCFGAFLCARQVLPGMLKRGGGCILFTGATAAVKAGGRFAAFASAKFALRGLAQSMARELGPQGIHVAHVVIDGIIWTPRSRDMHAASEKQCLQPDAIAATYLHLIGQHRSAWTQELDIRPDVESF